MIFDFFNLNLASWRRLSIGAAALAVDVIVLWLALMTHKPAAFTFALGLAALASAIAWVHHRRRYRLLADTPVARISSAPQGYVEIVGHARDLDDGCLICPGTRLPVVWYRVEVAERQSSGSGRDSYVHQYTLESDHGFLINDGSGRCLIDPDAAEITTQSPTVTHEGRERFTAWTISVGEPIYALGEFVSVRDQPADFRLAVSLRLAEWKKDQHDLLRRFDKDRNGQIDIEEWESARQAAENEVSAEIAEMRTTASADVMRAPKDGRPFLVATEDPATGARRHRIWSWLHLLLMLLALHFTQYLTRHPALIPGAHLEQAAITGPVTHTPAGAQASPALRRLAAHAYNRPLSPPAIAPIACASLLPKSIPSSAIWLAISI